MFHTCYLHRDNFYTLAAASPPPPPQAGCNNRNHCTNGIGLGSASYPAAHKHHDILKKIPTSTEATNKIQPPVNQQPTPGYKCSHGVMGCTDLIAPKYPLAGHWLMSRQVNRQPATTSHIMFTITTGIYTPA